MFDEKTRSCDFMNETKIVFQGNLSKLFQNYFNI